MQNLAQETGVIYVMDRAYADYKSLYCIELQGSVFVTRMKRNGSFKMTHDRAHKKEGPILSDMLIELTGAGMKKKYPNTAVRFNDRIPPKVAVKND
jgi:hypothetical protein